MMSPVYDVPAERHCAIRPIAVTDNTYPWCDESMKSLAVMYYCSVDDFPYRAID
jgi:hypothetical protein